jgi:predicted metal-dependent phosphoesterase TrpH|tara:strand:+ start:2624 stop:3256 length:633 start_codon:yes stop_codon:yes gene_type:complete
MRYDLHNHTHYSPCSNLDPKILLNINKQKGMNGIAVTDHNTIKGGIAVKKLNKDKNFEVIVGCEITTNYGDVLCYYLDKDIKSREFFSVIDEVKKQNGLIVIPHPFRTSLNPKHTFSCSFEKIKNKIDGMECFNARNLPGDNEKAQKVSKKLKIAGTGGSDAHFRFEVSRAHTIFEGDLRTALKQNKTKYTGTIMFGPFGGLLSFLRKRM